MELKKLKRKQIIRKRRVMLSAWFWTLYFFLEYQIIFSWCKPEEAIFISIFGTLFAVMGYAYMMDEGVKP